MKHESESDEDLGCIVGAVVHVATGRSDAVRAWLEGLDDVEVHERAGSDRWIVTIEAAGGREAIGTIERIQGGEDVRQITLAYQYCDEFREGGWQWR